MGGGADFAVVGVGVVECDVIVVAVVAVAATSRK